MAGSSIEWTEMTWNPTTGCTKISAGCKFCYAEVMSKRLHAMGVEKYKDIFKLRIHPGELNTPYRWKKPRIVFVNSMSDMFHKDVPLEFIQKVFKVMNDNPQHTFQVLTKRADLVAKYDKKLTWTKNIWMGTSVEDERVIKRIDYLRKTSAKVKFLSLEPLIGDLPSLNLKKIDWVIVGGESGHKARPIKKEWIIEIKKKCDKAKVPFFFKQWGKKQFNPDPFDLTISAQNPQHAKGGCSLNGKVYRDMPK
ncbi:MAG: phage Gp37/Gp68 family protein [Bacteroidetes bacterium]|nr:phage Gp37/Gp68 family protein [Bacteroidota bacterium]